jgi:hypothetical protein
MSSGNRAEMIYKVGKFMETARPFRDYYIFYHPKLQKLPSSMLERGNIEDTGLVLIPCRDGKNKTFNIRGSFLFFFPHETTSRGLGVITAVMDAQKEFGKMCEVSINNN